MSGPYVIGWYALTVPGASQGAWRARVVVAFSQSRMSSNVIVSVQPGIPAVLPRNMRVVMALLPWGANSGQYLVTGAFRSSSPRSARMSAHRAVIVFAVEKL